MRYSVTERLELAPLLLQQAERVLHTPWHAKVWAALLGVVQATVQDLFGGILCITALASGWDYVLGRRAREGTPEFSQQIAENGLLTKLSGIVLLIIVRLLEMWAAEHGLLAMLKLDKLLAGEPGAIATFFTCLVLYEQWKSLQRNHERLGRPLPFAAALNGLLERLPRRNGQQQPPQD